MEGPCRLCPRQCLADRVEKHGFCSSGQNAKVAGVYLHKWEEPCISGKNGSGTIFFSGCTMRCVYCQNHKISHEGFGKEIKRERLAKIMSELQEKGAENISLITPTHFTDDILYALDQIKDTLTVPVIFNSGGYENVETLKRYKNYIDVYMPDFKYYDNSLAKKYSSAPDYRECATKAIHEMISQVGSPIFDNGMLKKGVLVRHLVLPSHYRDSLEILKHLKHEFGSDNILLSLMSQFTPTKKCAEFPEINRKITTYEYQKVADYACELGFNGFMQDRSSASTDYTPPFELEGV